MGRNRGVGTLAALREIHAQGGGGAAGVAAFWRGTGPKLVESASKGAILVYAKESLNNTFGSMGMSPGLAGALAGAGGGVCQTTIMGPCTFLVTGAVTGNQAEGTMSRIGRTWREHGVRVRRPAQLAIRRCRSVWSLVSAMVATSAHRLLRVGCSLLDLTGCAPRRESHAPGNLAAAPHVGGCDARARGQS